MQRHVLRGRDDDRAGDRVLLGQRQLHVAGAGRQVDDQGVELAPGDLAHQLLQRAHQHRPRQITASPSFSISPIDISVTPWACSGRIVLPSGERGRSLDAHHPRLARPVDVGVEQPGALALQGERHRQVGSHRRLADAALARRDGDDPPHPRHRGGAGLGGRMPADLEVGRRWRRGRPLRGQQRRDPCDPRQRRDRRLGGGAGRLEPGALGRVDLEQEAHLAALDRERPHHVRVDEAAAAAGHRHGAERIEDGLAGHGHGRLRIGAAAPRAHPARSYRQPAAASGNARAVRPRHPHSIRRGPAAMLHCDIAHAR